MIDLAMSPAPTPRTLNWTPAARRQLEEWLARRVAAAAIDGAAAEEVSEGLRAHVHEELLGRPEDTVDEAQLARVLAAIDGPTREDGPARGDGSRPNFGWSGPRAILAPRVRKPGFRWPRVFFFFGVILPGLTWVVEWALGLCAAEFFDPMPTLWHVALVALVPASLWWVYRVVQRQDAKRARPAALLSGVALAVTLYYSLAFGTLLGLAAFGAVFCVLMPWLLPLPWMTLAAPVAGVASLFGVPHLRKLAPCGRVWALGVALGVVVVAAGELPRLMALQAMHTAATAPDENDKAAAVNRLRWLPGARSLLHEACFGEGRNRGGAIDITSWTVRQLDDLARLDGFPEVTMEQARSVYYRVTGRAFTEVKPRSSRRFNIFNMRLGVGRAAQTDWVWDNERGGEAVGARLPGLSAAASRMEWHAEPDARLAYGEWTLEFANEHANAQEARAQIQLPPGACVSRLTLWVNGEPQEAAFAAQSAVRSAYQKVVVVEQRDPVLVTQVGPDVVMMQCFPVPRNGGRMKVRLGITAPFDPQGRLFTPQFIERNFSLPHSLRHIVWVQSRSPFEAPKEGSIERSESGAQTWQADVETAALGTMAFTWPAAEPESIWCEDPLAGQDEARFVTARWQTPDPAPPATVGIVIDGSLALRPMRAAITQALQAANGTTRVAAWISTDAQPRELDLTRPDAGLTDADFAGGRDSLGALRSALSWTRSQSGPATVLWLHGPQPAALGDPAALEQMLEFGLRHIPIVDVPVVSGAHRLTEKLYRRSDLRAAPRLTQPSVDLAAFLKNVLLGQQPPALVVARQTEPPATGTQTTDQLARYAAFASTLAAFQGRSSVSPATIASAARHQVVTPVTGAVVLENKRQYAESGLSQVDPSSVPTVPTIPEPGVLTLLMTAAAIAFRRRR